VNMTSYGDVTNSVYPVTITTTLLCSKLDFGRGASNQAVVPGITRPLHATDLDCIFSPLPLLICLSVCGVGTWEKSWLLTVKTNLATFC